MKYFLNRGFNGYFDLVEIDGKNHPALFLDGSEEPLVFNTFYSGGDGDLVMSTNTRDTLNKDLNSINSFLSS